MVESIFTRYLGRQGQDGVSYLGRPAMIGTVIGMTSLILLLYI